MAPTTTIAKMSLCTMYDDGKLAIVEIDGEHIEVEIDPNEGPKLLKLDGTPGSPNDVQRLPFCPPGDRPRSNNGNWKPWKYFTATEREVAVHIAAKRNKASLEMKAAGVKAPAGISSAAFWSAIVCHLGTYMTRGKDWKRRGGSCSSEWEKGYWEEMKGTNNIAPSSIHLHCIRLSFLFLPWIPQRAWLTRGLHVDCMGALTLSTAALG